MKLCALSLALAALTALGADDEAYSEAAWLREGLAAQIPKYERITITPHPRDKAIAVANCETDLAWWSWLQLFHYTGDKVDWMAQFPPSYRQAAGCYVISCEWRYLPKLEMWVLEIFDSTHMGNGSLWLFEVKGRNLRELLHTAARGRFLKPPADLHMHPLGETRLLDAHLSARYARPNSGETTAEGVTLTGTIVALDSDDKEVDSKPFTETWVWNAKERVFSLASP